MHRKRSKRTALQALTIFEGKQEAGELPKVQPEEVLKVGQIVWLTVTARTGTAMNGRPFMID